MYMDRAKFDAIKAKHSSIVATYDDVSEALELVADLLMAEASAVRAKEPHAVNSIKDLQAAAREVYAMLDEVDSDAFWERK
jgi:phosphate uptake regulator